MNSLNWLNSRQKARPKYRQWSQGKSMEKGTSLQQVGPKQLDTHLGEWKKGQKW